jgi:hypothetical protein
MLFGFFFMLFGFAGALLSFYPRRITNGQNSVTICNDALRTGVPFYTFSHLQGKGTKVT